MSLFFRLSMRPHEGHTHESCDHAPDQPASSGVQATDYGGLSPADLSNVIVAYDSGYPNPAGWPVGYDSTAMAMNGIIFPYSQPGK
jgi:hypothetical protein